MKNFFLIFVASLALTFQSQGQEYNYAVNLEAITIPGLGGLQSYAVGTYQGEWLIIGGRLDGLHMKQPFASFNADGNNNQMMVINPEAKEIWTKNVDDLPVKYKEQFSSSNMEFYQEEDHLLLIGGYAYSPSKNDHITFPYLTVINVPETIQAIKEEKDIAAYIQQIEDEKFAVTGGSLEKMNDKFYLVGGQKFTGRYNPHGPNNGPGFRQEYTYEVRPFSLNINDNLSVSHEDPIHDEMHLRRRDYNLLPQLRNGREELMVFSGVFQASADIPWLYPIAISENSYEPLEEFTQLYNHYHCASLPIYHASEDEMHNLFFGGIAQFYDDNGTLVQDDEVPFVNTIADVVRLADGSLKERKLTTVMPNLLGASAEFILLPEAPLSAQGIIDGDLLDNQPTLIGYIYGGIKSSQPNIFWINDGSQSEASNTIYKVSISKLMETSTTFKNTGSHKVFIYPNPTQQIVRLAIELEDLQDLNIEVFSIDGKKVGQRQREKSTLRIGKNLIAMDNLPLDYGTYLFKIKIGDQMITQKVVVSE